MHLLLDFDGVVLKNHPIHKVVVDRCTNFVHKVVKCPNKEFASKLNKDLYYNAGHTLYGLNKLGYEGVNEKDFEKYVYKDIDYNDYLYNVTETHKSDIESFKHLETHCKKNNIEMLFFSNAPDIWCYSICNKMGISQLPTTYSYMSRLKPEPQSYMDLDLHLNSDLYVFVDDKLTNLLNTPNTNPNKWQCIWMHNTYLQVNNRLTIVKDLKEVCELLDIYQSWVQPQEPSKLVHACGLPSCKRE